MGSCISWLTGPCRRFAASAERRRIWRTRSDRLAALFVPPLLCFSC